MKRPIAFFIFLLIITTSCTQYTLPENIPTTKTECEAQNGEWKRIGLDLTESCNLKTGDGGSVCSDTADCQGDCIAELTGREQRDGDTIITTGKCAAWTRTTGCHAFVENGRVNGVICKD
jgi:hypothetical protein